MSKQLEIINKNEATILDKIDREKVKSQIYEVRGLRVMLDSDIAAYFGVTTGNLNKAKNRNIERFPENFCFTLSDHEISLFQFGIPMQTKGIKGEPPALRQNFLYLNTRHHCFFSFAILEKA